VAGGLIRRFRGQREFHIDLIGRRRWWFALSGLFILISIFGLVVVKLNLGIDFQGGARLVVPNRSGATPEEYRLALEEIGRGDAVVQLVEGRGGEESASVRTETLGDERAEVLGTLGTVAGVDPSSVSIEDVGPKWGRQISLKALQGLIIFLIVVSIYIALRFEWKMAGAAIVALLHDLIITAGVYALIGREVTPETVIAILTIMGYSLYDSVVIFDKVEENAESVTLVSKETYSGVVNISLNQVLMRSINTSLTTLLPIGALMLFGGETLKSFAFALFIGVMVGTYSSIFVAAPILAVFKEREPGMAQIRDRVRRRAPAMATVGAGGAGASKEEASSPAPSRPRPAATTRPRTQPPRRKGKKRPRSKRKKR
jgi:preprotein translocase subunit SecF